MRIGYRRAFEVHIMSLLSFEVTVFTNLTRGSIEYRTTMWELEELGL